MTPLLAAIAVALVLPLAWSAVRTPSTARLAVRNLARRRGEALLVTGGALLGTAIITASLVTGDVIDASVRSAADNFLGPIDVRVRTDDPTVLADWTAAAEQLSSDEVDGLLPWVETTASVVAGDRGEANVTLAEADPVAARAFGDDPDATGLADVTDLAAGEAVIAADLAADLGVAEGATLTVHAFGTQTDLAIAHVLPRTGLVGYGEVLTTPGTVTDLAATTDAAGLRAQLLVSTTGGVRDAAPPSDDLLDDLRALATTGDPVADERVDVQAVKQEVLDDAADVGTEFTTLFGTIGSFAVIAGVLLLVNLFVMLAEERRRDLGTLRALGMRRGLLARTFALEGGLYAVAAAVAGVAVGTGLGIGVAAVASNIFQITEGGLSFAPVVEPASLLTGGLLGFVISLVTAWVLSLRIARANIVRSLRELPEPARPHRVRTTVLAALGVLAGAATTAAGINGDVAEAILAGVPLALLSSVALLRRVVPTEVAMGVAGAASVAWALVATSVWSAAFAASEMTVFVVQGVVLVAGAVTLLVAADRAWGVVTDVALSRRGGLAVRLGTAYPLARRSRTALLLGMFAIVVFTMTFISTMDAVFAGQADRFSADAGGDWEVFATTPASATGAAAALAQADGVAAVAPLDRRFVDVVDGEDTTGWALTGFDEALLAASPPVLSERDATHGDDEAVYAAVLADPGLVIVNDGFGDTDEGGAPVRVGDEVTLAPMGGADADTTLRVVGVLASDMVFHGGFVGTDVIDRLAPPSGQQRFNVDVTGDAEAVAARLDAALVEHGVAAETFDEVVAREVAGQSSFLRLLQVFLGLGLVIGVAGLGVVLVRAVRERTRQVGTLRAIGVRRATVARAFLVEAGFVAVQGVVVGGALGVASAWQVLSRTDAFGQQELAFVVPWAALAIVVAVPLLAALAATAAPARRAAAIRPAVALRVAD